MALNPSKDDQPLDAMTGDELRAHALMHGFVLDDSLADPDSIYGEEATLTLGSGELRLGAESGETGTQSRVPPRTMPL